MSDLDNEKCCAVPLTELERRFGIQGELVAARAERDALEARLNWLIDRGWHPQLFVPPQCDGIENVRKAVKEHIDAALAKEKP